MLKPGELARRRGTESLVEDQPVVEMDQQLAEERDGSRTCATHNDAIRARRSPPSPSGEQLRAAMKFRKAAA